MRPRDQILAALERACERLELLENRRTSQQSVDLSALQGLLDGLAGAPGDAERSIEDRVYRHAWLWARGLGGEG
jgi:hypothetical protein